VTERRERSWRCHCGHDHFLSVIRYGGDPEGMLSFVDGVHCRSLRCRLKSAWNVLRGGTGSGHYGFEMILSPETTAELIAELLEQWPEAPKLSPAGYARIARSLGIAQAQEEEG
jgi:hypothetical protein